MSSDTVRDGKGLSKASKIGIGVAIPVAFFCALLWACFLLRRRRRAKARDASPNDELHDYYYRKPNEYSPPALRLQDLCSVQAYAWEQKLESPPLAFVNPWGIEHGLNPVFNTSSRYLNIAMSPCDNLRGTREQVNNADSVTAVENGGPTASMEHYTTRPPGLASTNLDIETTPSTTVEQVYPIQICPAIYDQSVVESSEILSLEAAQSSLKFDTSSSDSDHHPVVLPSPLDASDSIAYPLPTQQPKTPQLGKQLIACNGQNCEKRFKTRRQYRKHYSQAHNRRFKCNVPDCGCEPFGLKADLVRHQRVRHPELKLATGVFNCPERGCESVLNRKDNLDRHVKTFHQTDGGEG